MQFTPQTITIFTPEYQPYEMEAMVGEDSGLAYYMTSLGYIVTTTHSGYAVANLSNYSSIAYSAAPYNERVVQHFIENIASLLDWRKSQPEIQEQARFCFGDTSAIGSHLRKAFIDACEQVVAEQKSATSK